MSGVIEPAVRRACEGREHEPLVQVAYTIAATLDAGVDDKALAGMARELRLTLDALGIAIGGASKETSVVDELRAKRNAAREARASS